VENPKILSSLCASANLHKPPRLNNIHEEKSRHDN
jgi:hypothetical protein